MRTVTVRPGVRPLHRHFRCFMSLVLTVLVSGHFSLTRGASPGDSSAAVRWVGTWTTAPQLVETANNPPSPYLSNNTLRQIVRISIGGDTLRMRLSNEFSKNPVTLHAVHFALSQGGGVIDTTTDRVLTFGGKADTTMAPGGAVTSDPIRFPVPARTDIAVTIFFGATSPDITGHPGSRTTSYLVSGDQAARAGFTGAATTDHWYVINAIDVLAPPPSACVAILGNSITDGRGSVTNRQNRWPDFFSESLLADSTTQHVGVLNQGIGGNAVIAGGLGPTAVSRYDRDILDQNGLRWVIVFEGVNDIGGIQIPSAATSKAANIIAAYGQMIAKAHAKNIRIYGATILPFHGNKSYYTEFSEQCRATINQWIRAKGNFDACIDFDKVIRSPADTTRLGYPSNQNDSLHLDTTGYKVMGRSIDHSLFTGGDTVFQPSTGVRTIPGPADCFMLGQNYPNPFNPVTTISFGVPTRSYVSLDVLDVLGREVRNLVSGHRDPGRYSVSFDASTLSSGMYIYRLTAEKFTQAKKMVLVR